MEDLILTLVRKIRENQKRLGGRKLFKLIAPELPEAGQIGRDAFLTCFVIMEC